MPIPVLQFPQPTLTQAVPALGGFQYGTQLAGQMLENQRQRQLVNYLQSALPEQLKITQAQAQYAPARQAALAQLTQEQAKLYPALTESQIRRARIQNMMDQFKAQNPLLAQTGVAGQIGTMIYLQQHPELMQKGAEASPGAVAPPEMIGATPTQHPIDYQQEMTRQNLANMGIESTPGHLLPETAPEEKGMPLSSTGNPMIDALRRNIFNQGNLQQARGDWYNKRVQAMNYQSLPIDQKSMILAQAAGMGYDPTTATQLFMNGNTLANLAKAKGIDPNNLPDPIYPVTKGALNQIQQRQQSLAEINTLNPILTQALAPYSRRIFGYSPKQIGEALKGTDKEQQAKYLAARALMPEMSAMRMRAMQGKQIGIEAIRDITNASMGNVKAYQAFVDPAVYTAANRYIDQWLNTSIKAANRANLRAAAAIQKAQAAPEQPTIPGVFRGIPGRPITGLEETLPTGLTEDMIQRYQQKYPGRNRQEIISAWQRRG